MFCNASETTSQNYNIAPEITSLSKRGNERLENKMKVWQIGIWLK
jgi:hypothetical protein